MTNKYTKIRRWIALGSNCYYCGAPFGGAPHLAKTVDHRHPLSRGGTNAPGNLVASCSLCNQTKGNMTESEFLEWRARGRPNKKDYLREIGLACQPLGPTVKTPDFDSGNHGSNP